MSVLTVRNLPDHVHTRLREQAAREQVSVEGLVRRTLAEATLPRGEKTMPPSGFAEASLPFIHAAPGLSGEPAQPLWGALKGSVWLAADTDLTAPADEAWQAEA